MTQKNAKPYKGFAFQSFLALFVNDFRLHPAVFGSVTEKGIPPTSVICLRNKKRETGVAVSANVDVNRFRVL